MKTLLSVIIIAITTLFLQCKHERKTSQDKNSPIIHFNPDKLTVNSAGKYEKARGQILYLPLYSNIPYSEKSGDYDLSGFLAIHNTDLRKHLRVSHIYYFDTNGDLIKDFLGNDTLELKPLQSKSFFIPEKDKSGTGSNFLIEWKTDSLINIPLIETVMISLKGGQGVSFLSNGKVIEQSE